MRLLLLISLTYFILFLPTLLFAQQRQNMTYDVEPFAREHRIGHLQGIDTLDVLTYRSWNVNNTKGAKYVQLLDLPQGFGARAEVFVRDDTVIVEPDTIRFARFTFRGKKQIRQDFTMIRVSDESYDKFNSKGRLIRREFVSDPELVFKDARFRKDKGKIKNKLRKKKKGSAHDR